MMAWVEPSIVYRLHSSALIGGDGIPAKYIEYNREVKSLHRRSRTAYKGNYIYDATLTQTHIGENNNKFFIMQVLESDPHPTQFIIILLTIYTRDGEDLV
ncbi:hypothetical protein N665_0517s0020 [Sinapis alba]|nr:hypothetical protein N665_0517s0020 [Sinapis alba]